jgi:DNA-binding NarL/FixJ family response regulator
VWLKVIDDYTPIAMDRTLIVEDNDAFRQTLRNLLCPRFPRMSFEEARDGEEALDKITEFQPDIILMDIKLPGENGLEITRKIRGSHCNAVIIILTSFDLPEYRQRAYQYGAKYFLSKASTTSRELISLVESILSGIGNGVPAGSA